MKYLIMCALLCACTPKEQSASAPVSAGRGCLQPSTFQAIPNDSRIGEVIGVMGDKYTIADSNDVGMFSFKTLQWKDCGNVFSVTFRNDQMNSRFMIGGVQ